MSFAMLSAQAMKDPAAVYCTSLGYSYEIKSLPAGEVGICRFGPRDSCSAAEFLFGSCGSKYSYCNRTGLAQRIGSGAECGSKDSYARCAVCVLENGSVAEVTRLMNLSFREPLCGDGLCEGAEDMRTCREDCIKGVKVVEIKGIDKQVTTSTVTSPPAGENEPSKKGDNPAYLGIAAFVLILIVAVLILYRKKQDQKLQKERSDFIRWKEEQGKT